MRRIGRVVHRCSDVRNLLLLLRRVLLLRSLHFGLIGAHHWCCNTAVHLDDTTHRLQSRGSVPVVTCNLRLPNVLAASNMGHHRENNEGGDIKDDYGDDVSELKIQERSRHARMIQLRNPNASRACASEQMPPLQKLTQYKAAVEPALDIHMIQRNHSQAISTQIHELKAPCRLMDT